jgi:hypothetical protein
MPLALKAAWEVRSGLHPQHVITEDSKSWHYTSEDYEKDRKTPPDQPTIFSRYDQEAHDYARSLTNPRHCNYVRVEFLWL